MPTTSQHFSDLQLPTIFGDETTYGTILNTFIDGLAAKVADLNTRLATATTQLGDNSTSGSILHGINQLNTLNAQVAANSPALVASNVLTGTETNIITSPDQFSGDRSTTSSFPAVPNASGTTANVLSALSPPTTEAEILAFDYLAFYNALAPVVADLATRVSQIEADIASARVNICKTKKYTNARQGGGTVERYWSVSNTIIVRFTYSGTTLVGSTGDSVTFSIGVSGSSQNFANFYPGLTNAGYATDQQSRTYYNTAGGSDYTLPNVNSYNIGDSLTVINIGFFQPGNVSFLFDSLGLVNGQWTGNWIEPYTLYMNTYFDVPFSTITLAQRTVYSVTGLSECDTNPGGPHFTSGSYT